MAQSSNDLQVLEKQIDEYKQMELEKIKEINDLKGVNYEWEQKTKQILFEIQQNDVMLEKKEFERNVQMDELYSMIENQQSEIERLTTQLEH